MLAIIWAFITALIPATFHFIDFVAAIVKTTHAQYLIKWGVIKKPLNTTIPGNKSNMYAKKNRS